MFYIEINCGKNEQDSLVSSLKVQEWFEIEKLTQTENSILIGPYDLETAKRINEFLNFEINIPAVITSCMINEDIENNVQEQDEFIIEYSSNSKYVDKDTINYYEDETIRKIINYALELYTLPYRWGGTNLEKGIDCSFFVKYVYSKIGINLPRTSREQFKIGVSVEKKDLKVGDLVFFKKTKYKKIKNKLKKYEYINHVGIYLKDNEFIHAARGAKQVTISSLLEPYFEKHYAGAKRVLDIDK
ncbi:MAG: C40 family peptidase [Endomicrobia bacterium]|nr:C40 family peptidase [Endomicrobiia bacterium]